MQPINSVQAIQLGLCYFHQTVATPAHHAQELTSLENQEHFNNRPNAKLYNKSVTKTNETVQKLDYLMGILHRYPTHVSHLINQTSLTI